MWSVEVVSHETIKPSSPTPPHLHTHKLSWLDLIPLRVHMSIVIFYSGGDESALPILKNSLSETLTLFYPLAGRLNPNNTSVVDCNDDGVDLFVARAAVDTPLSHLLNCSFDHNEVTHLLPPSESTHNSLLSVQITLFDAGRGMAIGVSISHTLADCHSISEFITAWAAVTRGDSHVIELPLFDAASRFLCPVTFEAEEFALTQIPSRKLVMKRFVFEEAAIDTLQKTPTDHLVPTRVVAVASLLWRCCVRAREAAKGSGSASMACIPVNMRGKAGLPNRLLGNICAAALAMVAAPEVVGEKTDEAKRSSEEKMRSAISEMNEKWVRKVQGEDGRLMVLELMAEPMAAMAELRDDSRDKEVDYYFFSSWTRFRFCEADFGWGKPLLVAPARWVMKNFVALMGRGEAGGMEAWMNLEENEMMELEKDEELMSFASHAYNNLCAN